MVSTVLEVMAYMGVCVVKGFKGCYQNYAKQVSGGVYGSSNLYRCHRQLERKEELSETPPGTF